MNTEFSSRSIKDGWQQEQPDNWLRRPDPWEVARPEEQVKVNLNCAFKMEWRNPARHSRTGFQFDRHSL